MASARTIGILLVVQATFGLFPVASKLVLPQMDPLPLLALRVGGAAFCLMALNMALTRKPIPVRTMWPKLIVLSLLGVVLNMGMFMLGLEQGVTAVEAVLLITTIPVFTYGIAVLAKKEDIGPRRILGIIVAMLGVVYLVLYNFNQDQAHVLGDLLILGNALSYAAFLVMAKPIIHEYDALSLTTWVFAIGAVVFVPVGMAMGLRGQFADLSTTNVWWIVFIILGPSCLTYALNGMALKHVPASTVGLFTYVQPLFAALFSAMLLPTVDLNPRLLPAAGLVFAGVWLVVRRKPKVLEGQLIGD